MLREIENDYRLTGYMTGRHSLAQKVKSALQEVPRHKFVPYEMQHLAYQNTPLPIGHNQTISQPFIVALMTDLLCTNKNHAVLEIGTGCGYQTAVLARLVKKVFSIEIVPALASQAAECLQLLCYDNVEVREGDGYYGWPENAPYDGIIITAATPEIPGPLIKQLKAGGKMVLPIGYPYASQDLIVVTKQENGGISQQNVLAVAFVPLTGKHD
jgi:protein-L-isoaspartate(D-aspartate) O-methyltransferase